MVSQNINLQHTRLPFARYRVSCAGILLASVFAVSNLSAQATPQRPDAQHVADIENRLNDLTNTLAQTQKALQQSLVDIDELRTELNALRQTGATPSVPEPVSATSAAGQMEALHEQQEIQQAEIKQHEQTKVETASKYNLKVTGLALFSAFSNAGVVDNAELPSLALPRNPGAAHGSVGATLRQTVFGVVATGPVIGGAQSSAILNADFFGGATTNTFGYTSLAGYVRMRDTQLSLDWSKTTLEVGYTGPLISPLSPTSYATIAEPALSASGNLWSWSPQIRLEQRVPITAKRGFAGELGLIFPASPAYTSVQLDSPVEASRRPGVEGRLSFQADNTSTPSPHTFTVGISGYTANQFYSSTTTVHSWAVTSDWQIPVSHWVDISGEIYRGRSLGGLGGGLYKDILTGTSPVTGQAVTVGVDTAGGWTQLKLNMNSHLEANAMFGLDDAFASSFRSVVLPSSAGSLTLSARNSSVTGNLILRPRSSLIFSPEYRRISTWRITGAPYIANIFTLSAGYQF
jgi:hypothetical protein